VPRRTKERIQDILDAVSRIRKFTAGMSFDDFQNDERTVQAVEYNFIVIGEAAGQVPPEVVAAHPEIPWREMRGLRNVVAHGYFAVSVSTVWETVNTDLPPLVAQLSSVLDELTD
jgi:uncharacterized protein with HEPN domain